MNEPLTVDFRQPIPMFPLEQVVIMPGCSAPLHVFEPRYRSLASAALDGQRVMAMAVFHGDEYKVDYYGTPAVRPVVCLAQIAHHERLDDGRYHLMLRGLTRCAIETELDHEPYRHVVLRPIDPPMTMEIDLRDQRLALDEMLRDEVLASVPGVRAVANWATPETPTAELTDIATMALERRSDVRYEMLAQPDPAKRADWLVAWLRRARESLRTADRRGTPRSDDGLCLN